MNSHQLVTTPEGMNEQHAIKPSPLDHWRSHSERGVTVSVPLWQCRKESHSTGTGPITESEQQDFENRSPSRSSEIHIKCPGGGDSKGKLVHETLSESRLAVVSREPMMVLRLGNRQRTRSCLVLDSLRGMCPGHRDPSQEEIEDWR